MNHSHNEPSIIVRHLYLDEAGLGDPNIEAYTVVAGIFIHVDNEYEALRKYLLDMADNLVAPDERRPENFYFHAKDLWHGGGFFPRKIWPREKRLEILGYLADIPHLFDLPIVYSCIKRDEYAPLDLPKKERAKANRQCHGSCFVSCLQLADKWMELSYPNEKIFAVVENHRDHKDGLHRIADVLSDPRTRNDLINDQDFHFDPLKHFVETPLFANKSGSSPSQIADTCAFILGRALANENGSGSLLDKIKPQLINGFIRTFFEKSDSE